MNYSAQYGNSLYVVAYLTNVISYHTVLGCLLDSHNKQVLPCMNEFLELRQGFEDACVWFAAKVMECVSGKWVQEKSP